ncbi:hypothetical protein K402DRAFT_303206, partial [Aulographum hederae CBS 113979]
TEKIYELGAQKAIQFDLSKTELIHFSKSALAKSAVLALPDGSIIQPKQVVRWLGIWFNCSLNFKEHANIRCSQARAAFFRMARLANSGRGLSPTSLR